MRHFSVLILLCAVQIGWTESWEESRSYGVRFGGICLWGPDFYSVDGKSQPPSPNNVFFTDAGYKDAGTYSTGPLFGIHILSQIPVGEQFVVELGPSGQWKENRLTLLFAEPQVNGFDRTIFKYNYWSFGGTLGILYSRMFPRFRLLGGGFFETNFAWWGSNVDNYTSSGKKCGSDILGLSGCTPLGFNGDKKDNISSGMEFGGGIKGGIEYRIARHFCVNFEAFIRYARASTVFKADYHVWEETAPYQDRHTELLLDQEIDDDATFSVSPSMFGISAGFTWYKGEVY